MGSMRAANEFVTRLGSKGLLLDTRRVQVELHGSLGLTGPGHGADSAVILGLCGEQPESIDPAKIESRLAAIRETRAVPLRGLHPIEFMEPRDLLFHKDLTLPAHPNGSGEGDQRMPHCDAGRRRAQDFARPDDQDHVRNGKRYADPLQRDVARRTCDAQHH